MFACVTFIFYTCLDVDFNRPKQMASMLSSCFSKIAVEIVKKRTLRVQNNKANTRHLFGSRHTQQYVDCRGFCSKRHGRYCPQSSLVSKTDTPQKFGPKVFQEIEAPRVQDNRHMKVVKVVSPMHRPPLSSRKYFWYLFLLESESTPGL
jgi:hypothetical protein